MARASSKRQRLGDVVAEDASKTPSPFDVRTIKYLVGLMSGASVRFAEDLPVPGVSYGYDHIRFTGPVFIGDTVEVRYEVAAVDEERGMVRSNVTCANERGDVVAVAVHILKFFPEEGRR